MNLSKKVSLGDIARNIGGSVIGDSERMVGRLVLPKDADRESICILWDARIAETLPEGALVIAPSALFRTGFGGIALENAKSLLPVILRFFAAFLVRDDDRRDSIRRRPYRRTRPCIGIHGSDRSAASTTIR